jgi:hypothetical protein
MVSIPTARFPYIVPPEILVQATYPGADAKTLEQSVATPIEQQMNGVDNMDYMYSTSNALLIPQRAVSELQGSYQVAVIECRLKRPGVDLKQDIADAHDRAFLVVLLDQVAGNLRLNLRIDVSVERRNPVPVDFYVTLFDCCDAHLRESGLWRLALFLCACG